MTDRQVYRLEITEDAWGDLDKLDRKIARQMVTKLERLAETTPDRQHEALTGRWAGSFKFRYRDYRAIYRLDHKNRLVIVDVVGHRRNVYDE